jgi:radical SAM protein with 4Fe4S-binding SPASM domain
MKRPPQSYCAAPWIEGIVYANGDLMPCCLSVSVLGNWQQEGLANAWSSERYQNFRKQIIEGKFPEDHCRRCYSNKYTRSLAWGLESPFNSYLAEITYFFNDIPSAIMTLPSLFTILPGSVPANQWQQILLDFESTLSQLAISKDNVPRTVQLAIHKLRVIGIITRSFLEQSLLPPIVAPFREVQLIARCNARCIQCLGSHTGARNSDPPTLDEKYIAEAFIDKESIISFFHNGSEFLFYNKWKDITSLLSEAGVKISLSTNSILLTPTNIKHLVDHRLLLGFNVSIDGATKETVEAIRVNVNYDHMMRNLDFLFEYASQQHFLFPVVFSFVLMKKNCRELPALVRLVDSFKKKYGEFHFSISLQMLALTDVAGYREFIQTQHPSLMGDEEIIKIFKATLAESEKSGIPIVYLDTSLKTFIEQGCPIPVLLDPLQFLERGELTLDGLKIAIGQGWHQVELSPVPARWITDKASVTIDSANKCHKKIHMTLASFHRPRTCRILANSLEIFSKTIGMEPEAVSLDLDLPQGQSVIDIISLDDAEAPNTIPALGSPDDRPLAFHFRGFEIT